MRRGGAMLISGSNGTAGLSVWWLGEVHEHVDIRGFHFFSTMASPLQATEKPADMEGKSDDGSADGSDDDESGNEFFWDAHAQVRASGRRVCAPRWPLTAPEHLLGRRTVTIWERMCSRSRRYAASASTTASSSTSSSGRAGPGGIVP